MTAERLADIQSYAALAEPLLGVFSSEKWLAVYGEDLSLIGIYNEGKQLVGGLYYLRTKKAGLPFIKLPPYSPHCGYFILSEGKNVSSVNSFQKESISTVCDHLNSQSAAITILAFPPGFVDLQPFIWSKYKVVPNYTYRIALSASMEEIRANFDPKNRNSISRAMKENLQVEDSKLGSEQLFRFFRDTLKKAGANVYENILRKIFMNFADSSNSFSLSASREGKLLGVVFCIYDKQSCYYLLGGTVKEQGTQGLNNLLVQQAIEKAKTLGCSLFDFEGSMLPGVEKFFRSFGPKLEPYYTINKAWLPLEILLKFRKRELF